MLLRRLAVLLCAFSLVASACSTGHPDQIPSDDGPLTEPTAKEKAQADEGAAEADKPAAQASDVIPIGAAPVRGPMDAKVTIVEFADYQCPFCARSNDTMHQLLRKYPDEVRLVYKQYPLPFHKQAMPASKAALAAQKQGKYWEMHDWLFEHQKEFRSHANNFEDWVVDQAGTLGMDAEQFRRDFNSTEVPQQIGRDQELAQKLSVRGTPHFFVNGERVKGAKPLGAFDEVVKARLKQANDMLAGSEVTPDNLYKKAVAANYAKEEPQRREYKKPRTLVEYVEVDKNDPVRGNTKDPLVTIVEFADYQCPFCKKVQPTVDKFMKQYGGKVRFVFKQLPLPMHPQANQAARAALAAKKQGKFWEMHELLFENQREFRKHSDDFESYAVGLAKKIGLDLDQFVKDYESKELGEQIEADKDLAQKIGARGTPNFFINGVNLRGAQPFSAFDKLIEKQVALAIELKTKKNLSGDKLYLAAVAKNKADRPAPEEPTARKKPPEKVDPSKLELGDAPVRGPKDAPVTIVAFEDFQCPYCSRGTKNLEAAMKKFKGKVRVAYKHYPLPFHQNAKPAARASLAAKEQGKFWEMHDLLFENQKRLGEDGIYEEFAKKIGLNMKKFREDMKDPNYDKVLDQNMKQGKDVGVRGTPAFFINGKRIIGAQPTSKFEEEIKKALLETK